MCITEYNEEKTLSQLEADSREDGIEIGLEKGKLEMILNMLSAGTVSKEEIAKFAGFTVERIKEIAAQNDFASI